MDISEDRLRQILREELTNCIQESLILEYAVPRKEFVEKIENLFDQIIENWCLVHYCTLVGRTELKEHWKSELRAHLLKSLRYKISGNNSYEARVKAIGSICDKDELNDANIINMTVNTKFKVEKIDVKSNEYKQCITDCANAMGDIINVIAKADIDFVDQYINII